MATNVEARVIISGGGPVGMALAIELGQRGISVLVLEKYATPQRIPKGQNLTPRTLEHFRAWQSEQELRAARPISTEFGIGGRTTYLTLLGEHSYDWLRRDLVRPYYAADNDRLPQYETEAVLRARVGQIDAVTLLSGVEVTGVEQDDDGVTVTARNRETGNIESYRGEFAVGCDGGRSIMRQAAGLTQTVRDHKRQMVLLVFQSDELHRLLLDRHPGNSFFNVLHPDLYGYWLFFGRVDLEGEFFFHAPIPEGTDPDSFDYKGFVERSVGAPVDMDINHRGFWDCRVAIANSYNAGRIFIAGDAAHNHPPYGGYGINTGFEDARNLGWKLAAHLQGWAGEDLLASYDAERRPVFESTATDFIEKSIETDRAFLATHDPICDRAGFDLAWAQRSSGASSEVGMYQPNYRGSPVVAGERDGTANAVAEHSFAARAGYHLAPRKLPDGTSAFDALGTGFTLIAIDNLAASEAFSRQASQMAIPLDVINVPAGGELADYDAQLILVRPDHFVAWAGDTADDPGAILRLATGAAA